MARNGNRTDNRSSRSTPERDSEGRFTRDSSGRWPIAIAAMGTAAVATGAYLWSRRSSDKPLMRWGQDEETRTQSDIAHEALEMKRSNEQALSSQNKTAGARSSRKSATGLDSTSQEQTKVGAVSYGA